MNLEFVNASYEIIGLSTCVLKDNNENHLWSHGSDAVVNITDNLSAVTKYEILESDIFTPVHIGEYEAHFFTITYLRDGKAIDSISYTKNLGEKKFGSLANPNLDNSLKLSLLNDFGPNTINKFKLMRKKTELTKEEIQSIIAKKEEMKMEIEKAKSK